MMRLLIVDDSDSDSGLVLKYLERFPRGAIGDHAATFEAALLMVRRSQYDIVLLDANLQGSLPCDTPDRVAKINAGNDSAVVVFTGYFREDEVLRAMKSGAVAYIQKSILNDPDEFIRQLSNIYFTFRAKRARSNVVGDTISNEELALMFTDEQVYAESSRKEIKESVKALDAKMDGINTTLGERILKLEKNFWSKTLDLGNVALHSLNWKNALYICGIITGALEARDGIRTFIVFLASIFHKL